MTTLSQIRPSRYSLHHTLADMGFPPLRVHAAVEALMGPEPEIEEETFTPSEADLADYAEWAAEVDRRWWDDRLDDDRMDEYVRWSKMQDCLDATHPDIRECDIRAAGLAI